MKLLNTQKIINKIFEIKISKLIENEQINECQEAYKSNIVCIFVVSEIRFWNAINDGQWLFDQ